MKSLHRQLAPFTLVLSKIIHSDRVICMVCHEGLYSVFTAHPYSGTATLKNMVAGAMITHSSLLSARGLSDLLADRWTDRPSALTAYRDIAGPCGTLPSARPFRLAAV